MYDECWSSSNSRSSSLNYYTFIPSLSFLSAGVGRTGTFIAIMVEMARIKSEKLVDIFNNVQYMRKSRPMMVMNEVSIESN